MLLIFLGRKKGCCSSKLAHNELDNLKTVRGKLGWISGQKRPDFAFETCMLSRSSNNSTVNKINQADKTFDKTKRKCLF